MNPLIEVTVLVPPRHVYSPEMSWIEARACELFGGMTYTTGYHGAWKGPDGNIVREPMGRVVVAVDGFGGLALAVAFAREVGRELGEHSVYVSAMGLAQIVEVSGVPTSR